MGATADVVILFKGTDDVSPTITKIETNVQNLSKTFNQTMKGINTQMGNLGKGAGQVGKQYSNSTQQMTSSAKSAEQSFGRASANVLQSGTKLSRMLTTWSNKLSGISASVMTFAGSMGFATLASNMWANSTQRQTNQIYLSTQRGVKASKELYDSIQQIVMEVPGDDTFMTSLLSMAAGLDTSLTVEGIRNLGDALADYYMAASAKGQLSYETEREMRNYMLSGQTRALTNSVLSQEIDLLKNKNTVQERALALQQALDKSGFGGLAHYESAKNIWEETKGHFQKGFADAGDLFTPLIQGVLKIYNTIDSLFGGGMSMVLVLLSVGFMSVISVMGIMGVMLEPMINGWHMLTGAMSRAASGLKSLGSGFRAMANGASASTLLANKIDSVARSLGFLGSNGSLKELATNINVARGAVAAQGHASLYASATSDVLTASQINQLMVTAKLSSEQIALAATTENMSVQKFMEKLALDENTLSTLSNVMAKHEMSYGDIQAQATSQGLSVKKWLETYSENMNTMATYENIIAKDKHTISTKLNSIAESVSKWIKDNLTASQILSTLSTVKDTIVKWANTLASKANYVIELSLSVVKRLLLEIRTGSIGVINAETVSELNNSLAQAEEVGSTSAVAFLKGQLIALRITNVIAIVKETTVEYGKVGIVLLEITYETIKNVLKGKSIRLSILQAISSTREAGADLTAAQIKAYSITLSSLSIVTKLGEIKADVLGYVSTIRKAVADGFAWVQKKLLTLETSLKTMTTEMEVLATGKSTIRTIINSIAEGFNASVKAVGNAIRAIGTAIREKGIVTIIKETVSLLWNTIVGTASTASQIKDVIWRSIKVGWMLIEVALYTVLNSVMLTSVAIILLVALAIYKIGESFGWWSSLSDVLSAIQAGFGRIWDTLMNSAPIQSITNLVYTLQTAIGGVVQVLGVFWDSINWFGDGDGFDIVSVFIDLLNVLGTIVYYVSGLWIIVDIFDLIGKGVGQFIDAWNLFIDSPLSTEMFDALGEAFNALKAPFQEISMAFGEVISAFQEIWVAIFGPAKDGEKEWNPFIEIIKGFAQFIINYVVPAIKVLAMVIRVLLIPLFLLVTAFDYIAFGIAKVMNLGQVAGDILSKTINRVWTFFKPLYDAIVWISDNLSGVGSAIDSFFGNNNSQTVSATNVSEGQAVRNAELSKKYNTGSNLVNRYNRVSNNQSTVVNNNYAEGSIPIDARNMTQKEAARTVQVGLGGYSQARRVTGK